ncbi:hypothetical protein HID58_071268, partial [Brassica napus]
FLQSLMPSSPTPLSTLFASEELLSSLLVVSSAFGIPNGEFMGITIILLDELLSWVRYALSRGPISGTMQQQPELWSAS